MKITTTTRLVLIMLALGAPALSAQERHEHKADIPKSMRDDHEEIMWELTEAMKQPGGVGAAARELQRVLHPHFAREEAIALPPLGVLRRLVEMEDVAAMQHWILPMTDSLRAELPRMLEEHKTIGAARLALARTAERAGNTRVVRLTEELGRHALSEEEMFYPIAVLVGEVVRNRMQKCHH